MMKDDMSITGRLTIEKYTAAGELVERVSTHNDIALTGRYLVSKLFNKDSANVTRVTKMCLGTADTAFDENGKTLAAKVFETPVVSIDSSEVIDSSTGRKRVLLRITGQLLEADANFVLKEAGLFTGDDVMYNRVTFGAITKTNQFKLTLIWEITF